MQHTDPLVELGRRLRDVRERRKMSVRGVAELVGIDESNLRNIERGGNATVRTVLRVAGFLEIEPAELFAGLDPYSLSERPPERLSEIEAARLRPSDRLR